VIIALQSERRKIDRELDALRKSFGVEVRQLIVWALGAHRSFARLAQGLRGQKITTRMLESYGYFPQPVIFPAVADRIGLLGLAAMDIVIIYRGLEIVRDAKDQLLQHRTPDNLPVPNIAGLAEQLMTICSRVRVVLNALPMGDRKTEERDNELLNAVTNEHSRWQVIRSQWPELDSVRVVPEE
jgi:hypothetical protein